MAKMWWNSLIVNPVVLGSWAVCAAPNALAQIEGYTPISQTNALEQVTSVSQLRDVSPGDWAYEGIA
ncbi:hypothetical protein [Coleofasciculus sp.]|uniref:hypothetical protein n=1 Tax=Coleofasciculus sp. TaxID=3100458 RepID=UPI003A1472BF